MCSVGIQARWYHVHVLRTDSSKLICRACTYTSGAANLPKNTWTPAKWVGNSPFGCGDHDNGAGRDKRQEQRKAVVPVRLGARERRGGEPQSEHHRKCDLFAVHAGVSE